MYADEAPGGRFPPNVYAEGDDVCSDATQNFDFFFQGDTMYPEYFGEVEVLFCPSAPNTASDLAEGVFNCESDRTQVCPCRFGRRAYIYLSWATTPDLVVKQGIDSNKPHFQIADMNEAWMMLMTDMHGLPASTIGARAAYMDKDIPYSDFTPDDPRILYRLREGVERFLITAINGPGPAESARAQSTIPVMFDELRTDTRTNMSKCNHVPGGCNVLYMDGHVSFVTYPGEWPVTSAMTVVMGFFNPLCERQAEAGGGAM
ncbi:MAG: hypothetical protein GY851_14710 [bacterium]|nr:hypothetical protein [bacterium]